MSQCAPPSFHNNVLETVMGIGNETRVSFPPTTSSHPSSVSRPQAPRRRRDAPAARAMRAGRAPDLGSK